MILIRGAALKERGLTAAGAGSLRRPMRGSPSADTDLRRVASVLAPAACRGRTNSRYFAEQIVEFMKGTAQLILVGASPPVSFFAYPNKPSWCTPEDCRILYLAHPNEDGTAALEALADAVKAPKEPLHVGASRKPDVPNGPLNPLTAGQVIAHFLPSGAIISDEGATAGGGVHQFAATIEPHDHLSLTGGADRAVGSPVGTGASRLPVRTGKLFVSRATAARCTRCRRCGHRRENRSTSRR